MEAHSRCDMGKHRSAHWRPGHTVKHVELEGGVLMDGYGIFGGYTRWAVVFLIIFVLFFLLVPGVYGAGAGAIC
jgi:hypothetical protein